MSLELFYKINSKATIKVDGQTPQEVFDNLSMMCNTFATSQCGCCKSDNLRYIVRKATSGKKEYNYAEIICLDCRARLSFGLTDQGQLYPKTRLNQLAKDKSESDKKRYEENEAYANSHYGTLPDGGFYKYKPEKTQPQTTKSEEPKSEEGQPF